MYLHGVGMTTFGLQSTSSHLLAYEAAMEALDDASMILQDVDAIVVATMENERNGEKQRLYSALLASTFQTTIPILQVAAYCGGGAAALWTGLRLGFSTVLVIGTDRLAAMTLPETTSMIMQAADRVWEQQEGLTFPAACAFFAQQYLERYPDATMDDLALIAYKNHANAKLNPKAPFWGKTVSLEAIQSSRVVASPLRVHDCSITVNGAAAALVSTKPSDIAIRGSGYATDTLSALERPDRTSWRATRLAADQAYREAGISAADISLAEVHDAFTITELMAYEDLGFAAPGEGYKLLRERVTFPEGSLPVNPSGGLKARGHPISPSGLAQVYEIANQFRSRCGERQLEQNLRYGLTHNVGGTGGVVGVHIFEYL